MERVAHSDDAESLIEQILDPRSGGDRYPLYRQLREIAPVHRTEHPLLHGWYFISGFHAIRSALTMSQSQNNAAVLQLLNVDGEGSYARMNRTWMEYQDNTADHDRIRKLFFPFFTPRAMGTYRELIRELITSMLDDLSGQDEIEIVSEFAFPLPTMVIARVLGIAMEDVPDFHAMMEAYLETTAMVRVLDDEARADRDKMTVEFIGLFRRYLEDRRRVPADDLITKLGQAAPAAGVSDEELLAQLVFVLIAGHSTTADMIGNALVALAEHPEQRTAITEGKITVKDALRELLRYDSSLEVATRYFNEDVKMEDVLIPAGSRALILLHSAHRDPAIYPDPDRLDLMRKQAQPAVVFGGGRYTCLGSALANIELDEALKAFLQRYPGYRIKDVAWQGSLVSHGPQRLVLAS